MKYDDSNLSGSSFITCLKVVSLLKRLFSCTNKACHNSKQDEYTQQSHLRNYFARSGIRLLTSPLTLVVAVAVVVAIALVVAGALVAEADMVQELVATVVELVKLVADVTVLVFVRVVAAGLAAKNGQG